MTAPAEDFDRSGPRPLALHLATAVNTWCGGLAVLPAAFGGQFPWHEEVAEQANHQFAALPEGDAPPYQAVAEEAYRRVGDMVEGILSYRRHPYRRRLPEPPVVWQEGTARILDYGQAGGAPGKPTVLSTVLFVPSLVNRAYILDLSERRSLMRYLAARGMRPLLLDWGAPGPAERDFGLDDYINGRLVRALRQAVELSGGPVGLVGYCMGGNLCLPVALGHPDLVAAAAFLATPWDFHAERGVPEQVLPLAATMLAPMLEAGNELPVDALQTFFAALNPNLAGTKFRRFRHMDPDSPGAMDFVALEDWLNDGVPVVAKVARECLNDWYGENLPGTNRWQLGEQLVDPAQLAIPALVASPGRDRIVRPGSSRALAAALPNAEVVSPSSGHIGMMVGSSAQEKLWQPLESWLLSHIK